jgi:transcriptional regulator with XRE-family HTH domain
MTLAARIRRARLLAELTQTDLATKIGVSRGAIAQWEQVSGTKPTTGNLSKLAVICGVRFEWLGTGRGVVRLGDLHQAPAAVMSEFAHDILESRLLLAIRRISMRKREAILLMIEGLGR